VLVSIAIVSAAVPSVPTGATICMCGRRRSCCARREFGLKGLNEKVNYELGRDPYRKKDVRGECLAVGSLRNFRVIGWDGAARSGSPS
jgi:hypothetical protein